MANFIAQIFGGGKKKENTPPPPVSSKPKPKPVTAPVGQPRAKTVTSYGGRTEDDAKLAKKMLLGQ